MPAERILRALDIGAMMTVAYPMSRDERQAVAAYLGTSPRHRVSGECLLRRPESSRVGSSSTVLEWMEPQLQ
jgi:hypothetical protein